MPLNHLHVLTSQVFFHWPTFPPVLLGHNGRIFGNCWKRIFTGHESLNQPTVSMQQMMTVCRFYTDIRQHYHILKYREVVLSTKQSICEETLSRTGAEQSNSFQLLFNKPILYRLDALPCHQSTVFKHCRDVSLMLQLSTDWKLEQLNYYTTAFKQDHLIAPFAITINSNVCPHIRVLNTLMRESYAWRHRNTLFPEHVRQLYCTNYGYF